MELLPSSLSSSSSWPSWPSLSSCLHLLRRRCPARYCQHGLHHYILAFCLSQDFPSSKYHPKTIEIGRTRLVHTIVLQFVHLSHDRSSTTTFELDFESTNSTSTPLGLYETPSTSSTRATRLRLDTTLPLWRSTSLGPGLDKGLDIHFWFCVIQVINIHVSLAPIYYMLSK